MPIHSRSYEVQTHIAALRKNIFLLNNEKQPKSFRRVNSAESFRRILTSALLAVGACLTPRPRVQNTKADDDDGRHVKISFGIRWVQGQVKYLLDGISCPFTLTDPAKMSSSYCPVGDQIAKVTRSVALCIQCTSRSVGPPTASSRQTLEASSFATKLAVDRTSSTRTIWTVTPYYI
jgi:hypothetical protein